MKIYGKLFDHALMMCGHDEDKDYAETITMYRDFKNKNYKYNCLTRALQLQFLTEYWGKLIEKCPRLMYNYNLLVSLWVDNKPKKNMKYCLIEQLDHDLSILATKIAIFKAKSDMSNAYDILKLAGMEYEYSKLWERYMYLTNKGNQLKLRIDI